MKTSNSIYIVYGDFFDEGNGHDAFEPKVFRTMKEAADYVAYKRDEFYGWYPKAECESVQDSCPDMLYICAANGNYINLKTIIAEV